MMSSSGAAAEADQALHALFEANRLLRVAGEKVASAVGQTHARRMVMQAAGAGATVPDIARSLGVQRQGVQRIADELAADGLGRFEDNPHHRRSRLFMVTDAGQSALEEIHQQHARWLAELQADTPDLDWSALRAELERLVLGLRPGSRAV